MLLLAGVFFTARRVLFLLDQRVELSISYRSRQRLNESKVQKVRDEQKVGTGYIRISNLVVKECPNFSTVLITRS